MSDTHLYRSCTQAINTSDTSVLAWPNQDKMPPTCNSDSVSANTHTLLDLNSFNGLNPYTPTVSLSYLGYV